MVIFILCYNNRVSNRLVLARKKRRMLLIDLLGGVCVDCSSTNNLEFDHVIREETAFRIGTALLMRLEDLLVELQKCQLLCHDCHVRKTNTEYIRIKKYVHGMPSMYSNRGCRCVSCQKSWNKYLKVRNYYRKSIASA